MSHKLGVCIPYRNRELHLNEFIPKVGKFLKEAGIDFQIYFAHQIDDKLFYRGQASYKVQNKEENVTAASNVNQSMNPKTTNTGVSGFGDFGVVIVGVIGIVDILLTTLSINFH